MNGPLLAVSVGILFTAIFLAIINFFSGGNTQIQSGGGGKGNVSISNKNGHVTIKGKVNSVEVNGKKVI